MIRIFFALLAMLLLLTGCSNKIKTNVDFIRYVNPLINEEVLISTKKSYVYNGPYADEVEFCNLKSGFICIDHPVLTFAIPRDLAIEGSQRQWKYNNRTYGIHGIVENFKLSNSYSKVYLISSYNTNGSDRYDFVYSLTYGLLYVHSNKHTPFSILQLDGKYGFGFLSE